MLKTRRRKAVTDPITQVLDYAAINHLQEQLFSSIANDSQRPYFPDQPACPCGHYYPDVIWIKDNFLNPGERYQRHFYCCFCMDYWVAINESMFQPKSPKQSKLTEMLSEEWRRQERDRIRKLGHM